MQRDCMCMWVCVCVCVLVCIPANYLWLTIVSAAGINAPMRERERR
jgi:hypothetical protein